MDIQSIVEALLFTSGEPLSTKKIAGITGKKKKDIDSVLVSLQEDLETKKRGVRLIQKGEEWLLVSAPEWSEITRKLKKEEMEGKLSPVNGETLAIIAYQGPITRAEINVIRGVDATYSLQRLLSRGLIERSPHPQRGNTYVYNISLEFLKHLGINKVEELPRYGEFYKKPQ